MTFSATAEELEAASNAVYERTREMCIRDSLGTGQSGPGGDDLPEACGHIEGITDSFSIGLACTGKGKQDGYKRQYTALDAASSSSAVALKVILQTLFSGVSTLTSFRCV